MNFDYRYMQKVTGQHIMTTSFILEVLSVCHIEVNMSPKYSSKEKS